VGGASAPTSAAPDSILKNASVGGASAPTKTRKPGTRALRRGRYSEPGRIYLLTTATHGREPLFQSFALGRIVAAEIRSLQRQGLAEPLAWVVMPDHLHLLLQLNHGTRLDRLMLRLKGRSARRINASPLWQEAFHDRALRREEDLREAARYIVANPVRAGLVQRVGDYPLWDAVWL